MAWLCLGASLESFIVEWQRLGCLRSSEPVNRRILSIRIIEEGGVACGALKYGALR